LTARSLRAAVSFLTVLPVANADGSPGTRLGRAYFPAVGALVGLVAGVVLLVVDAIAGPLLGAAAAVAGLCLLTGAIHVDGLGDSADGLLGRGDAARRLEVMRDPRLGSYGVTAVVVVLLLETAALAGMPPVRALVGLMVAGATSRLAAAVVIAWVPYVRASGLGVAAAGSSGRAIDLAIGLATVALVALLDWRRALVAAMLAAVVGLIVTGLARRRLGGITGDICGATAELGQLAVLLVFAGR
jgi:adenosylcobinamide-GDP ribazoletransferase